MKKSKLIKTISITTAIGISALSVAGCSATTSNNTAGEYQKIFENERTKYDTPNTVVLPSLSSIKVTDVDRTHENITEEDVKLVEEYLADELATTVSVNDASDKSYSYGRNKSTVNFFHFGFISSVLYCNCF